MGTFHLNKQSNQAFSKCNRTAKDVYLNLKSFDEPTDNKLLNAAIHYAKSGYAVFPLHNLVDSGKKLRCSCRNWLFCKKVAKHPRTRNGHNDATTDELMIREWWKKYPDANIGLLTGIQTGVLVLDIDIKTGGEYSLEIMQEDYKTVMNDEYEYLPATLTAITGSGGRHLYFNYPSDLRIISCSASDIADGLDIRANGGYVVAPPSKHLSGNDYSWFGVNTLIEPAPNWLIYELVRIEKPVLKENSIIKNEPYHIEDSANLIVGEKLPEGKRNTYLFKHVCGLVNSYPKEEVLVRAFQKNENSFKVPLYEEEVISIVNWAWKQYKTPQ